jgi:CheY-like chemotaxis protein
MVLLIDPNEDSRDALSAELHARGLRVLATADRRAAMERIGSRGERPEAIIVDAATPGLELNRFLTSLANDPLTTQVPVVVISDHLTSRTELAPTVQVMPRTTPVPDLLAMLASMARGDMPPPPARLAHGTGDFTSYGEVMQADLHAYAEAKLVQYLGPTRAAATLAAVLRECGVERILTTADLHCVAQSLRTRGTIESAVAALLSGRATLIDSDRTLRAP